MGVHHLVRQWVLRPKKQMIKTGAVAQREFLKGEGAKGEGAKTFNRVWYISLNDIYSFFTKRQNQKKGGWHCGHLGMAQRAWHNAPSFNYAPEHALNLAVQVSMQVPLFQTYNSAIH